MIKTQCYLSTRHNELLNYVIIAWAETDLWNKETSTQHKFIYLHYDWND